MLTLFLALALTTAPTTQPDSQDDVAHLRAMIVVMQQHIAALEKENAQLRADAANSGRASKRTNPIDSMTTFSITEKLKRGMNRDEVVKIMGREPTDDKTDSDGNEYLIFTFYDYQDGQRTEEGNAVGGFVTLFFDGIKVSHIERENSHQQQH